VSVHVGNNNTVDLEANIDLKTALALAQLIAQRDHETVDDAVSEALLLQAYFMKQVREGHEVLVRDPDGREMRVPFQELASPLI